MNDKSLTNLISLLDEYQMYQPNECKELYLITKTIYDEVNNKISSLLTNNSPITYVEAKQKIENNIKKKI
jgi:hypothetical protein